MGRAVRVIGTGGPLLARDVGTIVALQHLTDFFRERRRREGLLQEGDFFLEDAAVQHIGPVLEFEHPRAGRVRVLKHPVHYSSGEATLRRPPPELGEHTDEVLAELGCTDEEIAAMRKAEDI